MKNYIGLDLDGTICNYNAHGVEIRTNPALLGMLPPQSLIAIISNQGGLPHGRIEAAQVVRRMAAACTFLAQAGHQVVGIYASVFHPTATAGQVRSAERSLRYRAAQIGLPLSVFSTARSRKPSPFMLKHARISAYYGDSEEDRAAARMAGIPFVRVLRFE